MDILPKGADPEPQSIGGSPRGASFLKSTACWYAWALRYLVGYLPLARADYFDLGTAYHALMEGRSAEEVRQEYPDHLEEAFKLYKQRVGGPPIGPALAKEKEVVLFGGLLTSKPDRVEKGSDGRPFARDYKTAAHFSKHDEASWGVDLGILGEVASTAEMPNGERVFPHYGIVDIISKSASKPPFVKLVRVELSFSKYAALESTVRGIWGEIQHRVIGLARAVKSDVHAPSKLFPRDLTKCMGEYAPCPYYAHCWGKLPDSVMYKFAKNPPRRWTGKLHDEGDEVRSDLPLPKGMNHKLVETAAKKFVAWMKGTK